MFFYLIHNIINSLQLSWSESQKNCFTLFVGGNLYVFFFVLLEWLGGFMAGALRSWYYWFIIIDVLTMAIVYKVYWGRSIFHELDERANGEWEYDDRTHHYRRRETPFGVPPPEYVAEPTSSPDYREELEDPVEGLENLEEERVEVDELEF